MFSAKLHELFYIGLSRGNSGSKPVVTKLVCLLKFPYVKHGVLFFLSIYQKMQNEVYHCKKKNVLKTVIASVIVLLIHCVEPH